MKKFFILLVSVIMLAACTGNDDQAKDTKKSNEGEVAQSEQPENNQPAADTNNNEKQEAKSEDTSTSTENKSNFLELSIVFEIIGNDKFEQVVEIDNPNKRVILFEDQSHNKKYKSIYIKQNNRLKVIDLANDRLIFNDVL